MIERISKVLAKADGYAVKDRYVHGGPMWRQYEDTAYAVAKAMRDPTDEMMQAMYEAMFDDKWDGTQAVMVGAGFEAAIDAALAQ